MRLNLLISQGGHRARHTKPTPITHFLSVCSRSAHKWISARAWGSLTVMGPWPRPLLLPLPLAATFPLDALSPLEGARGQQDGGLWAGTLHRFCDVSALLRRKWTAQYSDYYFFRLNVKRLNVTTVSVWYLIWGNMIIHDSCLHPSDCSTIWTGFHPAVLSEAAGLGWVFISSFGHVHFFVFLISFCYMFSFYDTIR